MFVSWTWGRFLQFLKTKFSLIMSPIISLDHHYCNVMPNLFYKMNWHISMLFPCFLSCPYLHRTTGDTERKYHLRYYKTGTCIHETDARGHCVKNGLHCAFAHGPHDLRPPVYDIRWHTKQIVASLSPGKLFTHKPHNGTNKSANLDIM